MRLTIAAGDQSADYNVTLLAEDVTVADLLQEVGMTSIPAAVSIDGRARPSSEPIRISGLTDGSIVRVGVDPTSVDDGAGTDGALGGGPGSRRSRGTAAHLVKVAGRGSGDALALTAGVYDLGTRSDDRPGLARGTLAEATVRLRIAPDGGATVSSLSERPVEAAGRSLTDDHHELGNKLLVVADPDGARSIFSVRPQQRRGRQRVVSSRPGRVIVLRSPRRRPPRPTETIALPDPPAPVQNLQPLSLIAILGPIPAAVAMATLFGNPRMLLMAAFSPLLVVGRWLEGRRRVRKGRVRVEEELALNAERLAADIAVSAERVAAHLLDAQPHLGELVSRVELNDARIWERRVSHDDFLRVTLGYGSVPYAVDTEGKAYGPLLDVLANARLHGVPLTVPLGTLSAVGVAGNETAAASLVRAALLEASVLHGPADVQLAVISDRPEAWAWVKWLPHAADDQGAVRVATDHQSAIDLIDGLTPIERTKRSTFGDDEVAPSTVTVLVLDGDASIDAHTIRVADALYANPHLRVIVIGSDPDQLPSYCASVAVTDEVGSLMIIDPTGARSDLTGVAVMAETATVERVARRLGRLDDPEQTSASGGIPTYTALEELLSGEDLTPDDIVDRWEAHRSHRKRGKALQATVGVTQDGPFGLDIVRDGPHAVVAGTTGSGKSELLRSWVAALASSVGPDRVNFVLVDFKGGGAFDACNDFPHTVGVVTDLDEHLSARALRCLKAELHYRELRLRAAGASNIEEYWEMQPDEPLPRLMLIVDEFATLAQELPEFLTSLVDVAQRVRSLGIHMILATQRPSGVLDAKIKANTNLRIALRVQDDADSTDVIGTNAAARIDRRTPGRAMARLGASEVVAFQSALVTVATDRTLRHSIEVVPFGIGEQARSRTTAKADEDAPTDLQQLVDVARAAHHATGLAPCRVPWPDPLPDVLPIDQLPAPGPDTGAAAWAVEIGLADLPDEQRQDRFRFDPADGHLLVYGADTSVNTATLAVISLRMAQKLPPDRLHQYALDFASGGLSPLAELDHVATWVAGTDEERLLRVIERLERELDQRRSVLAERGETSIGPDDDLPLILVLIDNFGALVSSCEESGRIEVPGRIGSIIRDGADLGVVVVATSTTERGIPHRIAGQVTRKLVFRLADPGGYTSFGLRARDVPQMGPGRGIEAFEGIDVQVAQPSTDGLAADVARLAERWPTAAIEGRPQPVQVLPETVAVDEVAGASSATDDIWRLSFAKGFNALGPAGFVLRRGQHAIVGGPAGSGRTTALRSLATAARLSVPSCRILTIGFAKPAIPPVSGVEPITDPAALSPDQDEDQFRDGRTLILVDDADRVDAAMADALKELVEAKLPNVHIIAASTPDDLGSFSSWTKPLRAARVGLLLQPHRDDGELLRTRLPLRGASSFPVGRGFIANGGPVELAQVAIDQAEADPVPTPTPAPPPTGRPDSPAATKPRPLADFGPSSTADGR